MTPKDACVTVLLVFAFLVPDLAGQTAQDEAKKIAAAITAKDKANPTALNPECKLFTPAELATYAGVPLGPPGNATGGCVWNPRSGDALGVMLTVVPASYHPLPRRPRKFRELPDVGQQGYVTTVLGDWSAGAIKGANSINVTVSPEHSSEAKTIELLKVALQRVN